MSASPPDDRFQPPTSFHPIQQADSSELADLSHTSGRTRQRPGYQRIVSLPLGDDADLGDSSARGLGIDAPTSPVSPELRSPRERATHVPSSVNVGSRSPGETIGASSATNTPATNRGFLSPYQDQETGYRGVDISDDHGWGRGHKQGKPSVSSIGSGERYNPHDPYYPRETPYDPYLQHEDEDRSTLREPMHRHQSGASLRSAYTKEGWNPAAHCPSNKPFHQKGSNWLSISIYILSIVSTFLSGAFFVIAILGPRWEWISETGTMKPNGAIILVSVLAKTIELSFTTAFVAFLGQALCRRAFNKVSGKGMTLAELSMRSWITQPGSMIVHWETVRYAGLTSLGVLSLVAAIMAMIYTSAATALVQPQLRWNAWQPLALTSQVKTSWGNANWVADSCRTPQLNDEGDPGNPVADGTFRNSSGIKLAKNSCLQIEYAARSYQNFIQYMSLWTDPNLSLSEDMKTRPPGIALWENNTDIAGSWINVQDVSETSARIDRTVHTVQLAMPHVGVMQAATNSTNGILQPQDLNGLGAFKLRASVASPVVQVTCAQLTRADMAPIVYEEWLPPKRNQTAEQNRTISTWGATTWGKVESSIAAPGNTTIMDELFGWGGDGRLTFNNNTADPIQSTWDLEDVALARPVFPKLPSEFNTLLNHTSPIYGKTKLYMLGRIPDKIQNDTYLLCAINATLTPKCVTEYSLSGTEGGNLNASCEHQDDPMQFNNKQPAHEVGVPIEANKDWIYMASEWGNAVNLNDGLLDGDGSNSRILTHMALKERKLNSSMPSTAEALAVLASTTLLMGMQDAPFDLENAYTKANLDAGVYESFDTEIMSQMYASGIHDNGSRGFMLVLFVVFALNLFVLGDLLYERSFVTDFTETPNLFAIALNSPPNDEMAGACGAGPEGKQYDSNWFINMEDGSEHLYLIPGKVTVGSSIWRRRKQPSTTMRNYDDTPSFDAQSIRSPMTILYDKYSKRKSLL